MPDDIDYAWLRELLAHPGRWTEDDTASVRLMLETQRRALNDLHEKDESGRRSAQQLIDQLDAALRAHLAARSNPRDERL
jgi:hypothetical protein